MIRLLTASAIFAFAATAAQAETATVRFGDLNIGAARDAGILAGRIHQAAVQACTTDKPHSGPIKLFYRSGEMACENWVSRRAMAGIMARTGAYPQLARR